MALKLFPVCFLLCVLCLQMDVCPAIKVTITPKTFSKDKGSTVDVTCNLDNGEGDARDIVLMKIARKGERAIVLLHQNNSISYSAGNANEFPATGNTKGATSSIKLQMTITTPDPEDSGSYTCILYYIDQVGEFKEHRDSSYLTVADPALNQLSKTVKKLEDSVKQGKDDIDDLKKKDATDSNKLDDLEGKLDRQAKDIQDLVSKDADVDKKLKEVEQKAKDQIKKIADDANKGSTDKTKVLQLENTILHQADTIRDLTDKLSEFEKKLQSLNDGVTDKVDKKTSNDADEQATNDILNLKESVELHTKNINDLTDTASQNGESVEKLKGILNVVVGKVDKNKKTVSDFEDKLSAQKEETNKKIDQLNKEKEDDLGSDFTNLQNTVKEQTKKIKAATDKAKEASDAAKTLKDVTDGLAQQITEAKRQKSSSDGAVGFHVTTGVYTMTPMNNEVLKFNEMTLNEGQGFDLTTGLFTAPKAGIYAFMLYLQVPCNGCKLEATIIADNKILSRFTGGNRYGPDQHSISAAAKLDKGDTVKAYVTYVNKNKSKQTWGLGYLRKCGFSGVLVAAS